VVILLHVAAALLYAVAAYLCWPADADATSPRRRAARVVIPVALLVHAFAIFMSVATPDGLDLSFANALSVVAGLVVLVAWAARLLRLLPALPAMLLPVAAVCALLPALVRTPHRFPYADEPWAAIHIAVALLAYASFVVAAMQAVVLTGLEKKLHHAAATAVTAGTPPLLTLERYLFRLITIGFVLLTLTLVSGFLFSEQLFGKPVQFTHKNVFSVAGWIVFALLLWGRRRYGWRGRTALKWILGGTLLLILGYLGSKFVIEVLLRR
jgi:ABC-type uncharacterized transport system permease subunit